MTIYLTGATGFVGSNFLRVAMERHGFHVFAALNRAKLTMRSGLATETVALVDRAAALASVYALKPDAIVHMAFFNDLTLAYQNRKLAWQVMVEATKHLLEAAQHLNIPFIFVSTDWVFDGTQGPADESTTRLIAEDTARVLKHKLLSFEESLQELKKQLEMRTI